ncbi:MAG: hypothetical protein AB7J13_08375 [Pyrinomonadaceae bacterium]
MSRTYMKPVLMLAFVLLAVCSISGQAKFNYAAQKAYIPAELGRVYLGMPFDEFAKAVDLSKSDVGDTRFEWLELTLPVAKGNVESLNVRIQGLSEEDKAAMLKRETVTKKGDDGQPYETEIDRLVMSKIPAKGFVYAMYIVFKSDFDLKSYAIKKYGKGETRRSDDEYHFYDTQWTKKTPDGLVWLIRCFHEGKGRTLQLLGRIEGTEWAVD